MSSCGAPGSTNRSENNPSLSFHRLHRRNNGVNYVWIGYEILKEKLFQNACIFVRNTLKNLALRDLRAELLGGKPKNDLKDDAVPIIFDHKTIPKNRRASLDRDSRNTKKTVVKAALEDHQEEINFKIKEASTDTSDLVPKREIGLSNLPKINPVRNQ